MPLYLGWVNWYDNGAQAYLFNGLLDDIGIWNRALTATEIQGLYTASGCTHYDTIHTTIHDTITTITHIIDTTHITVYDTITAHVSVTDTLLIAVNLTGLNPPNNVNTLIVYPNPSKDHIVINCGDISNLTGYTIKITNYLGQVVYNQPINQQSFYVDLNTFGGRGTYIIYILDPSQAVKSIN